MAANKNSEKTDNVHVAVRCRPLDPVKEAEFKRCVEMDLKRGTIYVNNPKNGEAKDYTFDSIYNWESKQTDVYDETARPIVDAVLQGFNGTILAYGQTGTGKTFTMEGVRSDAELRGIIPNSFDHIFNHIARTEGMQFLVRASYLEIYMESIRDLLSKDQSQKLSIREKPDSGVYVQDLSSFVVKSVKEIENVMSVGNKNRAVGSTDMNKHSSRSHAIFVITVECSHPDPTGENHIRVGKLNLVDLAGSERLSKTHASGQRQAEGALINLSLTHLGNVINRLVDNPNGHVPYRDSQLTYLLKDSLGGNAKTVMIANIGPADYNFDETISTLRYANRAKNIKNTPKINEDPKDALLREFQTEIEKLKEQLELKKQGKRRRPQGEKGIDGEPGVIEEEEIVEEVDEEEEQRVLEAERQKLERDKIAVLENTNMLQEEKQRLLSSFEEKARQIVERQRANAELASKIATLEGKLLKGGKNVFDRMSEQERVLEQRRKELAEKHLAERKMRQELEKKNEEKQELQQTYSSLQEEVAAQSKKLKQLWGKLSATKAEIATAEDEMARERQDLIMKTEELQRMLKLKQLIIENFIPESEVKKIHARTMFDSATNEWLLKPYERLDAEQHALPQGDTQAPMRFLRPESALGSRIAVPRFTSERAKIDKNPRFKAENILVLDLDMAERTTQDYEGPAVAPRLQAALDDALREDDEIEVDAPPDEFLDTAIKNAKKANRAARPKTAKKREKGGKGVDESVDPSLYPSSRGLVSSSKRFA